MKIKKKAGNQSTSSNIYELVCVSPVSPIGYRSDLVRTGQIDQTAFAANAEDRRTATELTVVVWLRRHGSSGFNIDVNHGVVRSRNVTHIALMPCDIPERAGANACSFAILRGTRAFRRRLQLDVQSIAGDIHLSAQRADTIYRLAICSSGCEIDIDVLGGNSYGISSVGLTVDSSQLIVAAANKIGCCNDIELIATKIDPPP